MRIVETVVLVAALVCWTSPASANTTITISEDTAGQQPLPFPITEGALILCEEGTVAPCTNPSDIVSFQNIFIPFPTPLTTGSFAICSDFGDLDTILGNPPADSPTCPAPLSGLPIVYLVEPAGGGDITYTPATGQPGFAPDPTYIIKGDGPGNVVPEPASLLLIGSGLCTLSAAIRRKPLN